MANVSRIFARLVQNEDLVDDRLSWPVTKFMSRYGLTEQEAKALRWRLADYNARFDDDGEAAELRDEAYNDMAAA